MYPSTLIDFRTFAFKFSFKKTFYLETKKNKKADIMTVKPDLTARTKILKTPRQAFDYFLIPSLKDDIIRSTNERIELYWHPYLL